MLFAKILWEALPFMTEFRLGKMPQACVRSEEFREKVRLLFATEGGGEGDAQLLPAGGDAADQLDVACALRGRLVDSEKL